MSAEGYFSELRLIKNRPIGWQTDQFGNIVCRLLLLTWRGSFNQINCVWGGSVFLAQYDGILPISQSTHTHAFAKTCKKCSTKKKKALILEQGLC